MKLLKKLSLYLLCWFPLSLLGQASGNINYHNTTQNSQQLYQVANQTQPVQPPQFEGKEMLRLRVRSLINVEATAYVAIFNIQQIGETAEEADALMLARLDEFTQAALREGVQTADILVDMVSFVPMYEYEVTKKVFSKRYNEIPRGFQLQKNIHVRYTDPRKLDRLVTAAAKAEIYDLVKVDYFVEDTQGSIEKLRTASKSFLQQQLKDYAALGLQVDTAYHIISENHSVAFPIERYNSFQSFSSTSLDAIKNRHNIMQVQKNTSTYYEKIPFNGFDIVLNPVVFEPAVQFSMEMQILYYLEVPPKQVITKTETIREREFMLLTESGELKLLKVEKE